MHFWLGVLAGAAALAVTGAARALALAPFLPELIALRVFEWMPMEIFIFFVERLGAWSKWIAFVGAVGVTLLAAGAFALTAPAFLRGNGFVSRWLGLTAALTALALFLVLPLIGSTPSGAGLYPPITVPAPWGVLLGTGTYAGVLVAGLFKSPHHLRQTGLKSGRRGEG